LVAQAGQVAAKGDEFKYKYKATKPTERAAEFAKAHMAPTGDTAWLGLFPPAIWLTFALLGPVLFVYNKPFKYTLVPPLGPSLAEKGDVAPSAATKGWFLSIFPFFNLFAAIIGLGEDAFGAEPDLRRFVLWFLLPFGISTIQLHMLINYRRAMRVRVADAATLVVCTVMQIVYLGGSLAWAYYSLMAAQVDGTLASHATRVRIAVGCVLFSCFIVVASMIYRSVVLASAVSKQRSLLPGTTVRTYFERVYLGASPSAEGIVSYQVKTGGVDAAAKKPSTAPLL
jgi:hypothetical protein